MQRRGKPGTPDKGPRKAITTRVPEDLFNAIERECQAAGYRNTCDYLTAVLAEHHNVPVPHYARRPEPEEPLLRTG